MTWKGLLALAAGLTAGLALTVATGCGHGSAPAPSTDASAPSAPSAPVSLNKADYPVFPDADAGADPSVPAEQGGKGFTGKGWETNTDFDLIGDPRAIKGGVLRDTCQIFPEPCGWRGRNQIPTLMRTSARWLMRPYVGASHDPEYIPAVGDALANFDRTK